MSLSQLEAYTRELAAAVQTLAPHCQNKDNNTTSTQPLLPPDAPSEAHRARQSTLVTIARLQALLATTVDFLHTLAVQNQLLACLQWLGEFQVLACIPLHGSVPVKDVADLAGVPESQLSRVLRMTATSGFLHEPQPGHVAHSALSAPFVTRPSYLDAAMFLAGTAAPAALQMASATQRFGPSLRPNETAYNLAFNTPAPFASVCEQRPKLQRQWPAFFRYGTSDDVEDRVTELLAGLEQLRCGNISVVEVNAKSTERASTLTTLYPSLHFTVQLTPSASTGWSSPPPSTSTTITTTTSTTTSTDPKPTITIHHRTQPTPQPIPNASLYILHLHPPTPTTPFSTLAARITADLHAHLTILRSNPSATLILTARLLPDRGEVDPAVEATARLRDLVLWQLANEREMEMSEVVGMVNCVGDGGGRLVVLNTVWERESGVVVVVVVVVGYRGFTP